MPSWNLHGTVISLLPLGLQLDDRANTVIICHLSWLSCFCHKALWPVKTELSPSASKPGDWRILGWDTQLLCSEEKGMQTVNSSLSLPGHRCSRAGPCCLQMLSTDLLFIVLVWPLMGQKANGIARISSVLKLKQHRAHKIFSCPDRYMLIAFCLLLANNSNSLGLFVCFFFNGYFILVAATLCLLEHWESGGGGQLRTDSDLTAADTDAALGFRVFEWS